MRLLAVALLSIFFTACESLPRDNRWRDVQILEQLPKDSSAFRKVGSVICKEGSRYGRPEGYCSAKLKVDAAAMDADFVVIDDTEVKIKYSTKKVYSATAYRYLTLRTAKSQTSLAGPSQSDEKGQP